MIFFITAASFIISAGLTYAFSRPDSRLQILDIPNDRSLHTKPVPRVGGLAICAAIFLMGLLAVFLNEGGERLKLPFVGASMVSIISFLDDRFDLNVVVRLGVQLSAAICLIYGGYSIANINFLGMEWTLPRHVDVILSVLFILWMVNLYNFMDGMDGFSGGMTVVGFGAFFALSCGAGNPLFLSLSLIVTFSALGFLLFNFPPAKIFMGDTGSSTLGFLVAVFSLWANVESIFPLWIGVLIFSPFIVDATITILHRGICGEKIWRPHKKHYYQRLVEYGWGHRKTVLWEYVIMALCGISAILATNASYDLQKIIVIAWSIIYGVIVFFVERVTSFGNNEP